MTPLTFQEPFPPRSVLHGSSYTGTDRSYCRFSKESRLRSRSHCRVANRTLVRSFCAGKSLEEAQFHMKIWEKKPVKKQGRPLP